MEGRFPLSESFSVLCLRRLCKYTLAQSILFRVKSLWPSDAICWHWPGTILTQVMACCLTAPRALPEPILTQSSSVMSLGIFMWAYIKRDWKLHFWYRIQISQGPWVNRLTYKPLTCGNRTNPIQRYKYHGCWCPHPPFSLVSPGYQQPWYWLCRKGRSLSYMRNDFIYLCHVNVDEWYKV